MKLRLNAAAWIRARLAMFFLPRKCTRRMPPVSHRCAPALSRYFPRRRSNSFPVRLLTRRRLAYTAWRSPACPRQFCLPRSGSLMMVCTPTSANAFTLSRLW